MNDVLEKITEWTSYLFNNCDKFLNHFDPAEAGKKVLETVYFSEEYLEVSYTRLKSGRIKLIYIKMERFQKWLLEMNNGMV